MKHEGVRRGSLTNKARGSCGVDYNSRREIMTRTLTFNDPIHLGVYRHDGDAQILNYS